MALVVPALRFFVVFLNVYETFKTLKPPPPSARRGGQPSVRAITQRKRDLKGCLAVWVVWCCYTAYERTFDRLVGIFLPFYSEIKSVFLLFLLLTRAKGAEPLFLHVLRPFIKPYAAVVDPILEISCDVGDFFFALSQIPLDYILSSPWFSSGSNGEPGEEQNGTSSIPRASSANSDRPTRAINPSISADHAAAIQASRAQNKRYGSVRSISDNQRSNAGSDIYIPLHSNTLRDRHLKSASTISLPTYSEHPSHGPIQYSQTLSGGSVHQVFHPPPAYPTSGHQGANGTLGLPPTAPEYHSPEWRTYPAFPSAYPPTPLPASASLPSPVATRSDNNHRVVSDTPYPPIPEGELGFDELLGRQHEGHPGLMHNSSNSDRIYPGGSYYQLNHDITRQQDEDTLLDDSMCSSEAGLSEDDFGISLRTPYRSPQVIPSGAYSSTESLTGVLTITDNATSLRTKKSSDSLSSGSSSLAGQKRSRGAFQGKALNTSAIPQSRDGTLRARPGRTVVPQDPLQSSPSEDENENEPIDDDDSAMPKRQRVLDPVKRKSTVRPALRGMCGAQKALPSRSVTARGRTVATASQATLRSRAGSVTANNSTIKGRKSTLASRQITRGGAPAVVKSSSTSSSQSGTWKGKVY